MKPGFESSGFRRYQEELKSEPFDSLIDCVKALNTAIAEDDSLGEGFTIGHSFFCNLEEAGTKELLRIVEFELGPLLGEYWYDEPSKAKDWTAKLRDAVR